MRSSVVPAHSSLHQGLVLCRNLQTPHLRLRTIQSPSTGTPRRFIGIDRALNPKTLFGSSILLAGEPFLSLLIALQPEDTARAARLQGARGHAPSWLVKGPPFRISGVREPDDEVWVDCRSTCSSINRFVSSRTRFKKPFKFVKLDIKELFMKGEEKDFFRCVHLFDEGIREPFTRAVKFLLTHQYVSSPAFHDDLWRVVCGSGMGLVHSSELCDIAFYATAGHRFVTNRKALEKFSIWHFFRFRDDFLLMCDAQTTRLHDFVQILRLKARYVEIEVAQVSYDEICMLDLLLDRKTDGKEFWVEFEPTSLQVPLSTQSCHHMNIHTSWPLKRIKRFARLSSSAKLFNRAKDKSVQRCF